MKISLVEFIDALIGKQAQIIEHVVYDMFNEFNMSIWGGAQLEKIGACVNCDRNGLSDENYRIKIKAFAATQNSSGKPNEVLTALKLITNADKVSIQFIGNATIALTTSGAINNYLIDNLRLFIEQLLVVGVDLDTIIAEGSTNSFAFSSVGFCNSNGLGFDDITGTSNGGTFTYIIT